MRSAFCYDNLTCFERRPSRVPPLQYS